MSVLLVTLASLLVGERQPMRACLRDAGPAAKDGTIVVRAEVRADGRVASSAIEDGPAVAALTRCVRARIEALPLAAQGIQVADLSVRFEDDATPRLEVERSVSGTVGDDVRGALALIELASGTTLRRGATGEATRLVILSGGLDVHLLGADVKLRAGDALALGDVTLDTVVARGRTRLAALTPPLAVRRARRPVPKGEIPRTVFRAEAPEEMLEAGSIKVIAPPKGQMTFLQLTRGTASAEVDGVVSKLSSGDTVTVGPGHHTLTAGPRGAELIAIPFSMSSPRSP